MHGFTEFGRILWLKSMLFLLFIILFPASLQEIDYGSSAALVCPRGCTCIGQTITCLQTNMHMLPTLPKFVPGINGGALQFFSFSRNPLVRLEKATFYGLTDLLRIELTFNQLVWLSNEAFIGLPSLRSLSLRGNKIATLPHNIFNPVYMLDDLDLSRNQLRFIPFSLENLIFLKRISLFANPLHCPCPLVDLSLWIGYLEPIRTRVTCRSPPEVARQQLTDLANRLKGVVNNTRLLGFQRVEDADRSKVISTHPYRPDFRELFYPWPWPHCPLRDFGGFEPEPAAQVEYTEDGETQLEEPPVSVRKIDQNLELGVWRDKPKNIEAVAGDVARFICGADRQKTMQITWIIPINATKHIRLHRRRQILEISEVHDYHQGTYACVISSQPGYHMTADAHLRIIDPVKPRITDAPPADSTVVSEHSDLQLSCSSVGRPRPRISWLWQEETLPLHLVTGGKYIVRSVEASAAVPNSDPRTVYETNQFILATSESTVTSSILIIRNVTQSDAHGRYICYASNRVGSARVSTVIRVVAPGEISLRGTTATIDEDALGNGNNSAEHHNVSLLTLHGEDLVRYVIDRARVRIEAAIKKTADRLRDSSRRRSAADVASLFRQPNLAALELAKAAEVYEAALDEVTSILRNRNQQKIKVDQPDDTVTDDVDTEADVHSREALGVRLTADQLAIIAQLSGCQESIHADPCSRQLCFHLRYRAIDGTCNSFSHPKWGAAVTPFIRLLPPQYENEINTPIGWTANKLYFGYPKPSARLVSRELLGNSTLIGGYVNRLKELEEWRKKNMYGDLKFNNASEELPNLEYNTELKKPNFESTKLKMMKYKSEIGALFDEDENTSGMLMQWGQFLDHDLDFTPVDASTSRFSDGLGCNETCVNDPPCFPILIPPGDPRIKHLCIGFARSSATCGSGSTSILLGKPRYREQLNQITAFIDASNVYGSEEFDNSQLRETLHDEGKLRTGMPTFTGKPLMPFNIRGQVDCQADPQQDFVPCFKAGDHRSNENLGLLSMHTLWVREHNRLADELRRLNPDWMGDRIYHEARKIVGAAMQAITFHEWLPIILGVEGMKMLGTYTGYKDQVNPTISNEFATAAMRFGHTLVPPIFFRLNENWEPIAEGHLPLHQAFFAPDRMLKDGGMDPIIRGLLFNGGRNRSKNPPLNAELTERLFAMAHELALDLAALNVQRGRDHGLPSYTEYAFKFCNLGSNAHPDSFEDLEPRISDENVRERLRKVYGHPGNIDLFTGGILEDLLPGARVGPTFACIIADQFKRLRDGDRFWFESRDVFTPAQVAEINRSGTSLSRIICENADNITNIQKNAFIRPINNQDLMSCSKIPKLNLAAWVDCSLNGATTSFDIGRVRRRRSISEDEHSRNSDSCPATIQPLEETIMVLLKRIQSLEHKMRELHWSNNTSHTYN